MLRDYWEYCCCCLIPPPKHLYQPLQLNEGFCEQETTEDDSRILELQDLILISAPEEPNGEIKKSTLDDNTTIYFEYNATEGYQIKVEWHSPNNKIIFYEGKSSSCYTQACNHLFSLDNKPCIIRDANHILCPYL